MSSIKIPEGYQTVMPYLILHQASEFLSFTQKTFNAVEKMKHLNDDGSIMHAEVQIGESTIMVGNSSEQYPAQTAGLYVHVENADESYKAALENGATSVLEPRDQDYGRSGGVLDPCGNTWWITSALV
ncbi:MAG TPA: VOC family protein [Pedobacter sp.]|jgi:uncharacterized glyoxalase superfamily protein PhnB